MSTPRKLLVPLWVSALVGCAIPERAVPTGPPTIGRFDVWLDDDSVVRARWRVTGRLDRIELHRPGLEPWRSTEPALELALPEVVPGDPLVLVATGPGGESRARAVVPVDDPAPVRLVEFSVTPTVTRVQEPVRVQWRIENARRVMLLVGEAPLETDLPESGRRILRLVYGTRVTLRVEGFGGPLEAGQDVRIGPPPPVIHRFTANPLEAVFGEQTQIEWSVSGATHLQIHERLPEGRQLIHQSSAEMGSVPLALLPGVHRFELEARNFDVEVRTAEATAVVVPDEAPRIVEFSSAPEVTGLGGDIQLVWSVQGAQSVALRVNGGIGEPVPAVGRRTVQAGGSGTEAVLIATAGEQSDRQTVEIPTNPAFPSIARFGAQPTRSGRGEPVTLDWATDNAVAVRVVDGIGQLLLSGPVAGFGQVFPESPTVVTLQAENAVGQTTRTLALRVGDRPRVERFEPVDRQVRVGRPVRWTWRVTRAEQVLVSTPGRGPVPVAASTGTIALRRTDVLVDPDATLIASSDLFTVSATAGLERLPPLGGGGDEEPNDTWSVAQVVSGLGGRLVGELDAGDRDCFALELAAGSRVFLDGCSADLRVDGWRLDAEGAPTGPRVTLDPLPCGPVEAELATLGPTVGLMLSPASGATGPVRYAVDAAAVFRSCGDGVTDYDEGCDDGNQRTGDGCDPVCQPEDVDEQEPNDSRPTATPVGPGAYRAAIHPVDVDHYAVTVPSGGGPPNGRWSFAVSDRDGFGCSADLVLTLADAQGAMLDRDDGDGLGCPVLDGARTVLAPGTYDLRVEPGPGRTLPARGRYRLTVASP